MTKEEFEAVLALEGRYLVEDDSQYFGPRVYIARVMEPVKAGDVDVGPYRNPDMAQCVKEVGDVTAADALQRLIDWYTISGG